MYGKQFRSCLKSYLALMLLSVCLFIVELLILLTTSLTYGRKRIKIAMPSHLSFSTSNSTEIPQHIMASTGSTLHAMDRTLHEFNHVSGNFIDDQQSTKFPVRQWCRQLSIKFANHSHDPVVALASFPGSGNTWLRYLLQQATGILTGSVYDNPELSKNGFPGMC